MALTRKLSLVVGLGEVGRPLLEVLGRRYRVQGSDLPPHDVREPVEFLHVCYPADVDDFVGVTVAYAERYRPEIVVIHSTVPVGTTRAVEGRVDVPVVNSPVRGKHARMTEELVHYLKFVGGSDPQAVGRVEAHLQAAGMRTRRLTSPEATELGKLTETTYFGLIIAFHQDVARMAQKVGASYDEVVSLYEGIGYLPSVKYFPGVIGGHCVIPNIGLLQRSFRSELLNAIEWSNALRRKEALDGADGDGPNARKGV